MWPWRFYQRETLLLVLEGLASIQIGSWRMKWYLGAELPETSVNICQVPSPRRGQSCKGQRRAAIKPTGRTSLSAEKRLSTPFLGIVPPAGTRSQQPGGTREAHEIHPPLLQVECYTGAAFKPNFLKVSEGKKMSLCNWNQVHIN